MIKDWKQLLVMGSILLFAGTLSAQGKWDISGTQGCDSKEGNRKTERLRSLPQAIRQTH